MQAVECHVLFGSSPALERFVAPREPRPVRRLRRVARFKCREWLMAEIEATFPRDRTARAGFTGVHGRGRKKRDAARAQISPGVAVTTVATQLGDSRKSLTLDTYSHVLTAD